jgi:HK97 gp10 family phage protein
MSIAIEVLFNRFPAIAEMLPEAMNQLTHDDAQALYDEAVATCPVDTGAMRDSHKIEEIEPGHWEVSVQKDDGLSGGKTYALFVNGGTIHMAAQPWFTDAIVSASAKMQASTLEGLL